MHLLHALVLWMLLIILSLKNLWISNFSNMKFNGPLNEKNNPLITIWAYRPGLQMVDLAADSFISFAEHGPLLQQYSLQERTPWTTVSYLNKGMFSAMLKIKNLLLPSTDAVSVPSDPAQLLMERNYWNWTCPLSMVTSSNGSHSGSASTSRRPRSLLTSGTPSRMVLPRVSSRGFPSQVTNTTKQSSASMSGSIVQS